VLSKFFLSQNFPDFQKYCFRGVEVFSKKICLFVIFVEKIEKRQIHSTP